MQRVREFIVTTPTSPAGVVYSYDADTEMFIGVTILQEDMTADARYKLIENIKALLSLFLAWAEMYSGCTVVERSQKITFEMFWKKYNDASRSSRKRSLKLWNKLDETNQVKAYYHYDTYNRNRGNAEKKYCETYLNCELWNN
jgi:hypothetical protein